MNRDIFSARKKKIGFIVHVDGIQYQNNIQNFKCHNLSFLFSFLQFYFSTEGAVASESAIKLYKSLSFTQTHFFLLRRIRISIEDRTLEYTYRYMAMRHFHLYVFVYMHYCRLRSRTFIIIIYTYLFLFQVERMTGSETCLSTQSGIFFLDKRRSFMNSSEIPLPLRP